MLEGGWGWGGARGYRCMAEGGGSLHGGSESLVACRPRRESAGPDPQQGRPGSQAEGASGEVTPACETWKPKQQKAPPGVH